MMQVGWTSRRPRQIHATVPILGNIFYTPTGFEPGTTPFMVSCTYHYATKPVLMFGEVFINVYNSTCRIQMLQSGWDTRCIQTHPDNHNRRDVNHVFPISYVCCLFNKAVN